MRPPPGAPITTCTCPFFMTIVGAIVVLRMRHGMRDGAAMFSLVKRKPELLRKKPSANPPEPHTLLFVMVNETALPSRSTADRCVVSPSVSLERSPASSKSRGPGSGAPGTGAATPYDSYFPHSPGGRALSKRAGSSVGMLSTAIPVPTSALREAANAADDSPLAGTATQFGSLL